MIGAPCAECGGSGELPDAVQAWDIPGAPVPTCPSCQPPRAPTGTSATPESTGEPRSSSPILDGAIEFVEDIVANAKESAEPRTDYPHDPHDYIVKNGDAVTLEEKDSRQRQSRAHRKRRNVARHIRRHKRG